MSDEDESSVQTDRSKSSNGEVKEEDVSNMLLSEEEEDASDESEVQFSYMRLRSERMARNHARLVKLGLVTKEGV